MSLVLTLPLVVHNVAYLHAAPLNAPLLLDLLAQTHTNSFHYSVCDCVFTGLNWDCSPLGLYKYFIDFLIATQNSTTLDVWLGLYPFTEAAGSHCLPPTDDPRTTANEVGSCIILWLAKYITLPEFLLLSILRCLNFYY